MYLFVQPCLPKAGRHAGRNLKVGQKFEAQPSNLQTGDGQNLRWRNRHPIHFLPSRRVAISDRPPCRPLPSLRAICPSELACRRRWHANFAHLVTTPIARTRSASSRNIGADPAASARAASPPRSSWPTVRLCPTSERVSSCDPYFRDTEM